jgi:hypothetical protein
MDKTALITLVDRWRLETHTFHLLGEMTITLQDVATLLRLHKDGRAVTGRIEQAT